MTFLIKSKKKQILPATYPPASPNFPTSKLRFFELLYLLLHEHSYSLFIYPLPFTDNFSVRLPVNRTVLIVLPFSLIINFDVLTPSFVLTSKGTVSRYLLYMGNSIKHHFGVLCIFNLCRN